MSNNFKTPIFSSSRNVEISWLVPWREILLEKRALIQLIKNFSAFVEIKIPSHDHKSPLLVPALIPDGFIVLWNPI